MILVLDDETLPLEEGDRLLKASFLHRGLTALDALEECRHTNGYALKQLVGKCRIKLLGGGAHDLIRRQVRHYSIGLGDHFHAIGNRILRETKGLELWEAGQKPDVDALGRLG